MRGGDEDPILWPRPVPLPSLHLSPYSQRVCNIVTFFFLLCSFLTPKLPLSLSLSLPMSAYYRSQLTISKNQKLKDKEERDLRIDEIAGKARVAKLVEAVDDGIYLGLQGAPLVH